MSSTLEIKVSTPFWKVYEKELIRFLLLYFIIQIVPLDWKYYAQLFSINWADLQYGDLFNLSRYYPRFVSGPDSYLNWVIAAALAAVGSIVWGQVEKNQRPADYEQLYYWLRVLLRYRLALGVISYGFLKIFLLQAPFPSISNLNTNYGDFTAWKIFSLSLGAAPLYEQFLGWVELIAGILLLYRQTASIGAFVLLCFISNVFLSNLAYEGGEHIYSLYLAGLAFFIFIHDLPRLINLLSYEKATEPDNFKPVYSPFQQKARVVLKSSFILVFILFYGSKTYSGALNNPHNFPSTPGLANAAGLYNVKEFVINKDTLPYSATSLTRWKDVVFEKWATISIRSKRPLILDSTNTEHVAKEDNNKIYELSGSASRHYYSYQIDSVNKLLVLHNKNPHYSNEQLVLHYSRPDANTIRLWGQDQNKDSINVVLEKINKKYLLIEGRRQPQKL